MSIVRWNPSREFDEFFNRFAGQRTNGTDENLASSDWSPAVDIRETDENFEIDLELPAIPAADVKVTVKDGVLAVTGERKYEKEVLLPAAADANKIKKTFKNGILELRLKRV
ncbi:MAG: Hsp20/alpha crystallin family protein [Proteobacteria bacterium]|nr:Hsp20/alpha crystallin family protein [Pseudomonadota bacterium]